MTPHYADPWLTVFAGDCREVLRTLPAESVHCVVTSPPYWGLRDYGTASWLGGDEGCDHVADPSRTKKFGNPEFNENRPGREATKTNGYYFDRLCGKCGATRQDNQLGLEPTPEQYVENMVAVFREVRRVLRNDGTLWLNLGDSYNTSPPGNKPNTTALSSGLPNSIENQEMRRSAQAVVNKTKATGLKPKDLVGIPWRVAFALQADGWYLRSDIIWSKPNPMPESVTDRPTKSHEYLFLLAKSPRYFFDADAVREEHTGHPHIAGVRDVRTEGAVSPGNKMAVPGTNHFDGHKWAMNPTGRNIRSVWTIPTQPYPGAHFAVFPPKLVEPCVKAGTSERGVCPECGAPWRRVVERGERVQVANGRYGSVKGRTAAGQVGATSALNDGKIASRIEVGWEPSCVCSSELALGVRVVRAAHGSNAVPATILDPFAGSGTVGVVAQSLSRRAILIDLNPSYIEQQLRRNAQPPLGITA